MRISRLCYADFSLGEETLPAWLERTLLEPNASERGQIRSELFLSLAYASGFQISREPEA